MLIPGLVSITFRNLTPVQVIRLAQRAGLRCIEWGGDVHVPHGDIARAADVRTLTEGAGLHTVAYGSYYRVGQSEREGLTFASVAQTAAALNAPLIRVWAGTRGSAVTDAFALAALVDDSRRIADAAFAVGLSVAYEYHGGTYADTGLSALRLVAAVDRPNLSLLWQPSVDRPIAERIASLETVLPRLAHVHVFQWSGHDRLALADGADEWRRYCNILACAERAVPMLIEFVEGDSPAALMRDATTLVNLTQQIA